MALILFGEVERIHTSPSAGPGARLRPLAAASKDKSAWNDLEDDFPNSGLVSWWHPPSDLKPHSVWYFQTEESPSYDSTKTQHDFFRVKGTPSIAIELLDLPGLKDEEQLREYLVQTGIPTSQCSSKRVVVRQNSGLLVGPLNLVLRAGRYYADEKELDLPIPLGQARADLSLAERANHKFLPPDGWSTTIGELDFSPSEVFLKRVLRDFRRFTPSIFDDVKLTERLIARYCGAVGVGSISSAQRYRLLRLNRLATRVNGDLQIVGDALVDFLAIPAVANLLNELKTKTREETIASTQESLSDLHEEHRVLALKVAQLRSEIERNKSEIGLLGKQHATALAEFEVQAGNRFRSLSAAAPEFLAEIALIRGALNISTIGPRHYPIPAAGSTNEDLGEILNPAEFLARISQYFAAHRLGSITSCSLLSSVASGFVPIVIGARSRESLRALGHTLAADRLYWLPMHPTLTAPTQIRDELVIADPDSLGEAMTVAELLQRSVTSEKIRVLVLDNINLSQIDSVLLPLIRQYADLRSRSRDTCQPPPSVPTPIGIWPANLLLAGLAIESPFSLPVSTELWSYATLVNTSADKRSADDHAGSFQAGPINASQLSYENWIEWLKRMGGGETKDPMTLAAFVDHRIDISPLFQVMLKRLAIAVSDTMPSTNAHDTLRAFAELIVIPYFLARGQDPRPVLEECPTHIAIDPQAIARTEFLFKKWGIGPNDQ